MKSFLLVAVPWVLSSAWLAGCRPQEPVSIYEQASTGPSGQPFDEQAYRKRLDHTLAAVVPREDQAWFLKLDASAESAEALRDPFVELLGSLDFVEGQEQPTWELPAGWKEAPGDQIAAAKATTEVEGQTYTVTLTALPAGASLESLLTQNVNRWLRQLGESALSQDEAMQLAKQVETSDGPAYWFHLVGIRQRRSAMPAGHPPVGGDAAETASGEDPAPQSAAEDSAPTGAAEGFTSDAPDGWKLGPARPNRKATFIIDAEAGPTDLRVSAWPGERGQGMGSLSMNLMRWSGQVGMPTDPQAVEKLESSAKAIQVGGVAGEYVELLGDEKGMAAAIVYRPGRVWFFLLSGPTEAVKQQRSNLKTFLESVEFTDQ